MNVQRKDATITNTDDDFPGAFEVVLSTPSKDRDGDELAIEDWKTPLPDHITFDMDHGMSVEKTVGSGVPSIESNQLIVRGTYSSLPRAQEVRTLVKEGHIRTTSVAFRTEKSTKDGKTSRSRELLNGAFVAIPANKEAVVLSAKAGARNSSADQARIQAAHDAIVEAGAECGPMDDTEAAEGTMGGRSSMYSAAGIEVKGKYTAEQQREMLDKGEAYRNADGEPSYPIGDSEDLSNAIHAVGRGGAEHDAIRAYIIRRARALGHSDMIPDNWGSDGSLKTVTDVVTKEPAMATDPTQLAQAVDAALDEGWNLLANTDKDSLPPEVQQALGCFAAAGSTVDQLLEAMNVTNPDEETTPDAKTADADALAMKMQALSVVQSAALAEAS
jgi:hypothetical protein